MPRGNARRLPLEFRRKFTRWNQRVALFALLPTFEFAVFAYDY
jgi:hypothetical protein